MASPVTTPRRLDSRNTKRGVTFSSRVLVRNSLTLSRYTAEEVGACYYNIDDFARMRTEIRDIVSQMDEKQQAQSGSSSLQETDDIMVICTRGLEFHTEKGGDMRRKHRKIAYAAVFEEQDRQFKASIVDEEKMALIYCKSTMDSKAQAYMMGLSDKNQSNCVCLKTTLNAAPFALVGNSAPPSRRFHPKDRSRGPHRHRVCMAA
jgi:hypothetical protein